MPIVLVAVIAIAVVAILIIFLYCTKSLRFPVACNKITEYIHSKEKNKYNNCGKPINPAHKPNNNQIPEKLIGVYTRGSIIAQLCFDMWVGSGQDTLTYFLALSFFPFCSG